MHQNRTKETNRMEKEQEKAQEVHRQRPPISFKGD